MSESILALLAAATILWSVGAYYLRGQDLSAFDAPERDYWPPLKTGPRDYFTCVTSW